MSGGDLPPRQKMIGLMYLVLLALLAMNVSKSILESFVVINQGIETTANSFAISNEIMYSKLNRAASENPAYKKFNDNALKVKKEAQELFDHIEGIKSIMYQKIDGLSAEVADTIPLASIASKDNYDEPSRLMGLADPAAPGSAPDCEECSSTLLKEKLNTFHTNLLSYFKDKDIKDALEEKTAYLETNEIHAHDGVKPWEVGMFYHNPLAAVVTTLSKLQSDVRTAEAEIVAKLYENIDGDAVSFNTVEGIAVSKKAYVLEGDSFSSKIFTAAYDDSSDPDIYITTSEYDTSEAFKVNTSGKFDINKIMKGTKGTKWGEGDWYQMAKEDVRGGRGHLKIKQGVGTYEWGGIIKLNTKKGPKVYNFSSSFEVGKPATTVSAEKMNVFYIGVDNPVSVSAPMPNFKASAPGLKPGKGIGQYIMTPKKAGKVTVVVSGIDDNGKTIQLGKKEFRVKRIPDPKSFCGGKSGSESIKKVAFKAASTIQAKMENFDFDISVKVQSFSFSTTKSGLINEVKVKGNKLNSKCKKMIGGAKRNQRFYIEKIKVIMPDGTRRQLAPIILKVI